MFISYTKGFLLASLAMFSMQAEVTCSTEKMNKVLNHPITVGEVVKDGFFHYVARKWAKANLPESDVTSFLKASEIWQTLASAAVDAAWQSLFGDLKTTPLAVAKLRIYGAALRKACEEVGKSLGLHNQFDDDTKAKYDKYLKGFVESVLARHLVALVPAFA